MITVPNAKINIGLDVLNKRSDGYHNIESVFYPIPLQDALEIIPTNG
jgi:4-diphosphocytidyl-2-C-methyl-D-erythritol kinase